MAAKRCIPTNLFYNSKFVRLHNDTTRLILIGLITDADDAGRGVADPYLLGRKLDQQPENIQEALADLEQTGFVQLYQGEEPYYFLCHWYEWEKLGKPTPSRYPAPPPPAVSPGSQEAPEEPGEARGNFGMPGDSRPEEEGEEKRREEEEEGKGTREAIMSQQGKIVPFPSVPLVADDADHEGKTKNIAALTKQIARILRMPVTEALTRLVTDYAPVSSLSLLGEADAAREWIDDPRRNKHKQHLTPAFFRRWLKREHEAQERRQVSLQQSAQATGTTGSTSSLPEARSSVGHRPPNLMHLAEEDAHAKGVPR